MSYRRVKAPNPLEPLFKSVTPIFTSEMGHRLRIVRWYRLQVSQKVLADALGISRDELNRIERLAPGQNRTGHFTYWRLKEIFGPHTNYIITGANPEEHARAPKERTWKSKPIKFLGIK